MSISRATFIHITSVLIRFSREHRPGQPLFCHFTHNITTCPSHRTLSHGIQTSSCSPSLYAVQNTRKTLSHQCPVASYPPLCLYDSSKLNLPNVYHHTTPVSGYSLIHICSQVPSFATLALKWGHVARRLATCQSHGPNYPLFPHISNPQALPI
ncbi:hypothetical protein FA13DRAFT_576348 [Coprinellus micaceus]|uniref:Uncharacterized protein n=1 Tax=Coprinellus micaceus TaxID=71717 RepID=A0A4Y7T7X7_COPMI|nr:hypothetical protein FA13DRAFT_576348 [Coprinellus micaceus]